MNVALRCGGTAAPIPDGCVALDLLACGFDPKKSLLFRQSDVPEVYRAVMGFSLHVTPMGLLERCHSYKDRKIARGISPNHGIFWPTRC